MDHQEYLSKRYKSRGDAKKCQEYFEACKTLENQDREVFQTTRTGWEILNREDLSRHPHNSLIPLYQLDDNGTVNRTAFEIEPPAPNDANRAKRVFNLNRFDRENMTNQLSVVPSLNEFKSTFLDIFCEGQLRYLNWNNVFAAGGGVLACTQPIPMEFQSSVASKRKYFHDVQYSSSDVDLFLYGLNEEEARAKLLEIYRAVSESCPFPVVCFRSAHAVTLVSQYPFRHIQIVLRLYSSPYEVLAGFDVDACTIGFDGKQVYADARCHNALVTRKNTIDLTRRSPSYEMRLAKYGVRGFEVEVNDLNRDMVDPGIYERPWQALNGLGKLLVLERLRTPEARHNFFEMQKLNRGAANVATGFAARRLRRRNNKLDSTTQERLEEKLGGTAEVSNYSTVFLPWGKEFNAELTIKLMMTKDAKLNNSWFSRSRPYRLHPCFFGTASEILQDCSPNDPPFPEKKPDEDSLLREHRETYVRGELTFISDDPGRQRIGSFHPLSEAGWAEGVYFHVSTENLFSAVNVDDVEKMEAALKECNNVDIRDFFGRTALHLSIIAGSMNCMKALLNHGANPSEKLAGGRNTFHLAAIYNRVEAIPILKDALQEIFIKQSKALHTVPKVSVSEDGDEEEEGVEDESALLKKAKQNVKGVVRCVEGDASLMPIHIAFILGNLQVVKELLKVGACMLIPSENMPVKSQPGSGNSSAILNPILLLSDDLFEEGLKLIMAEGFRLVDKGYHTIAQFCASGDAFALEKLFQLFFDESVVAMNTLVLDQFPIVLPIHLAFQNGNSNCVDVLMKTDKCSFVVNAEIVRRSLEIAPDYWVLKNWKEETNQFPPAHLYAFKQLAVSLATFAMYLNPGTWRRDLSFELENEGGRHGIYRHQMAPVSDFRTSSEHQSLELPTEEYKLLEDRIEKQLQVCKQILPKVNMEDGYFSLVQDHSLNYLYQRNQVFEISGVNAFWIQNRGKSPNDPIAMKIPEYLSAFLGVIQSFMNKKRQVSGLKLDNFKEMCMELENELSDLPHIREMIQQWRVTELLRSSDEWDSPFQGMETEEKFSNFISEKEAILEKKIQLILEQFNCPMDIWKFALENLEVSSPQYRANVPRGHVQTQTNPDNARPTAMEYFISKYPEEQKVVEFFARKISEYPIPSEKVSIEDVIKKFPSWLPHFVQQNMFRDAARKYAPIQNNINQDYDRFNKMIYPSMSVHEAPTTAFSMKNQELINHCFHLLRKGELLEEETILHEIPILCVDKAGRTSLSMAILSGNLDAFKQVIALSQKQLFKPTKVKKGKAPIRIDNFELLQEMEGGKNDDDDDDENDEDDKSDKEDDDDEKEDEDEEGSNSGDEEVRKKKIASATQQQWQSTVTIAQLLSIRSSYHLDSIPFVHEALGENKKRAALKSPVSLIVTPLQLAIILKDVGMVQAIIDQALKFDPLLLRSIIHQLIIAPNYYSTLFLDFDAFQLAVAMDSPIILQTLISSAAIGLNWEWFSKKFSVPLDFSLIKKGNDFTVSSKTPATSNLRIKTTTRQSSIKKKNNASMKGPYGGLSTTMYGEAKKKLENENDPSLSTIKRLPPPNCTLLHIAAYWGSLECYLYLRNKQDEIFSSVLHYFNSGVSTINPIRNLFQKAKERTPMAFSFWREEENGNGNNEVMANFMMDYFIGGKDDTIVDGKNQTVLHHAILGGGKLFQKMKDNPSSFSPSLISRSYSEISSEDLIRFTDSESQKVIGCSPLSLACCLNDLNSIQYLLTNLKLSPAAEDAYQNGRTPFHVAIHCSSWEAASILFDKNESSNLLLQPDFDGITPLMEVVQSGQLEGLIHILSTNNSSQLNLLTNSVTKKNVDGQNSFHLWANAREYPGILQKLMDWSVLMETEEEKNWMNEDYSTGRTPLDIALGQFSKSTMERQKQSKYVTKTKFTEPSQPTKSVTDSFINNPIVISLSKERVRAKFNQVRAARDRKLDALEVGTSGELGKEVSSYQKAFNKSPEVGQRQESRLFSFLSKSFKDEPRQSTKDFLSAPFNQNQNFRNNIICD